MSRRPLSFSRKLWLENPTRKAFNSAHSASSFDSLILFLRISNLYRLISILILMKYNWIFTIYLNNFYLEGNSSRNKNKSISSYFTYISWFHGNSPLENSLSENSYPSYSTPRWMPRRKFQQNSHLEYSRPCH